MRVRVVALLSLLLLVGGSPVGAQEPGRVGLLMTYPESAGLIFGLTDKVGVRVDLAFSRVETETVLSGRDPRIQTVPPSINTTTLTSGVSALFYVARWDAVRLYLSPRLEYGRQKETRPPADKTQPLHPPATSVGVSGSIGVEYNVGRHFAVFGESGLGSARQKITTRYETSESTERTDRLQSRSRVGVIFRF